MFHFELAFLGNALECLAGVLDPVLIILPVGRQQPDHLVTSTRAGPCDRARRVEYGLADLELVRLQGRAQRGYLRDRHARQFDRSDVFHHCDLFDG